MNSSFAAKASARSSHIFQLLTHILSGRDTSISGECINIPFFQFEILLKFLDCANDWRAVVSVPFDVVGCSIVFTSLDEGYHARKDEKSGFFISGYIQRGHEAVGCNVVIIGGVHDVIFCIGEAITQC